IFVGQIDNILGVKTPAAESNLIKLLHYFRFDYAPNLAALVLALLVVVIMVIWPKRLNARLPGSLLALVLVTAIAILFNLNVPMIGSIPQTILLDQRLSQIPWEHLGDLIMPALSIAALGAIESLLCGAAAGRMANQKFDSGQELIAQ